MNFPKIKLTTYFFGSFLVPFLIPREHFIKLVDKSNEFRENGSKTNLEIEFSEQK